MRTIIAILLVALAANVDAKGLDGASDGGVVTPDVASDGYQTSRFSRAVTGDTVICPQGVEDYVPKDNVCREKNGNNAWRLIRDAIPPGKTYAGFRIMLGNGYTYYQIYWK